MRPDLHALNAALLACDSATAVLEQFFGAPVRIHRLDGPEPPRTAAQIARLGPDVRHRLVELRHDSRVLSEADLWYVPAALDPAMNRALLETDIPFGRVVAALRPRRITLEAEILPAGPVALAHRALLLLPDGRPLAEVHERYPRW